MKYLNQQAYILHTRPYQNTSLLIDLFTKENGRVTVIARGIRAKRKSSVLIQPFVSLVVSYGGKQELKLLYTIETCSPPYVLEGTRLFSGLYLNELLMRLLPAQDPYPPIFQHYEQTLASLVHSPFFEMVLRLFEKHLLAELGYDLPLSFEYKTGLPISASHYYHFVPRQGFIRENLFPNEKNKAIFSGADLIAFAANQLEDTDVLQSAKRLMRLALASLLGDKPLKSRELFRVS